MNQKIKKILLFFLAILFFFGAFLLPVPHPRTANALGFSAEIPYGGSNTFLAECTCSVPNTWQFIYDYKTLRPLFLIYQPGASVLFEYFDIFGTFFLGSYQPGGGTCKMYVGEDCIDVYKDGLMGSQPGTGTSI